MAELTVNSIIEDGFDPDVLEVAEETGDTFENDGNSFIYLTNGNVAEITVTIASQVTNYPEGTAPYDIEVAVPAGESRFIGPINQVGYNTAEGLVELTYDIHEDVLVGIFSLG